MTTNDKLLQALRRIKALVTGDARHNWDPDWRTTSTRGVIADLCDEALAASKPEPQAQAEPCPNSRSDEFACKNRHQCWEPCGELGHSAEHARPTPKETQDAVNAALGLPQAQAGEPEVVGEIKTYPHNGLKFIATKRDGYPSGGSLEHFEVGTQFITLQSHREAMAEIHDKWGERGAVIQYQNSRITELTEAIAKRDAALKACVEAIEEVSHALYEIKHAKTRADLFTRGEVGAIQHQILWESKLNGEVKDKCDAAIKQAQEAQR